MAELDQPVDAGAQISNTPTNMALPPEAQFRNVNARLDELADNVSRIAKPATFRLADMIQLAVLVVGVVVALITGFGLNQRIDDLQKTQAAAEARASAALTATESRLSNRLDRVSDQVTTVDQRTANLEGHRSAAGR